MNGEDSFPEPLDDAVESADDESNTDEGEGPDEPVTASP